MLSKKPVLHEFLTAFNNYVVKVKCTTKLPDKKTNFSLKQEFKILLANYSTLSFTFFLGTINKWERKKKEKNQFHHFVHNNRERGNCGDQMRK